MDFIPSAVHEKREAESICWFLFCKDRILVYNDGNREIIPLCGGLEAIIGLITSKQYLGTLNGQGLLQN